MSKIRYKKVGGVMSGTPCPNNYHGFPDETDKDPPCNVGSFVCKSCPHFKRANYKNSLLSAPIRRRKNEKNDGLMVDYPDENLGEALRRNNSIPFADIYKTLKSDIDQLRSLKTRKADQLCYGLDLAVMLLSIESSLTEKERDRINELIGEKDNEQNG